MCVVEVYAGVEVFVYYDGWVVRVVIEYVLFVEFVIIGGVFVVVGEIYVL